MKRTKNKDFAPRSSLRAAILYHSFNYILEEENFPE